MIEVVLGVLQSSLGQGDVWIVFGGVARKQVTESNITGQYSAGVGPT